jgi:hypothetical protein
MNPSTQENKGLGKMWQKLKKPVDLESIATNVKDFGIGTVAAAFWLNTKFAYAFPRYVFGLLENTMDKERKLLAESKDLKEEEIDNYLAKLQQEEDEAEKGGIAIPTAGFLTGIWGGLGLVYLQGCGYRELGEHVFHLDKSWGAALFAGALIAGWTSSIIYTDHLWKKKYNENLAKSTFHEFISLFSKHSEDEEEI